MIFRFLKMVVVPILNFSIREILLSNFACTSEAHHLAKFSQNRSICCRDIAIYRFFKMAVVRHLGFVWGIFGRPTEGVSITLQNLVMIDAVVFII